MDQRKFNISILLPQNENVKNRSIPSIFDFDVAHKEKIAFLIGLQKVDDFRFKVMAKYSRNF